jgi:hypothetical protein
MANPYHDSLGHFCSKGEMQAEIKQLSKSGDFNAYYSLRKSYDEIQSQTQQTAEEKFEDERNNRIILNVDTEESTMLSYELIKGKLKREVGFNYYVARILASRYLSEEQREELIGSANVWDIRHAVEFDSNPSRRSRLSATDYKNIVAREDSREFIPLVAKNPMLPFEERTSLLENTSWGLAVLAMHNRDKFFNNERLTEKLRASAKDKDQGSIYNALADSPHAQDHVTVINSEYLDESYPSPAMNLGRNPSLSVENARNLIRKQIAAESSSSSSVAHFFAENNLNIKKLTDMDKGKISYHDATMTEDRKQENRRRIEELRPEASNSFVSSAAKKSDFLYGQIYANDADYKKLHKEYKVLTSKKRPTKVEVTERDLLAFKIQRADNIRKTARTLEILDEELGK